MEIGEKLALARDYAAPALTQEQLAEMLKVDTSTVGRWESKNHIPRDRIPRLTQLLNVREDWLFDGSDEPPTMHRLYEPSNVSARPGSALTSTERRIVSAGMVAIPIWRGTLAGGEDECSFEDSDSSEMREIPAFYTQGEPERHVLCIASGMSMAKRIEHAERALVRLDPDVPHGHLVVARSPEGRNYMKQLAKVGMHLELHSINPDFKAIENLKGWELKGGITAIFHTYQPGQPNIEWDEGRYLR